LKRSGFYTSDFSSLAVAGGAGRPDSRDSDAVFEMCFPLASRWLVDDGLIGKDGVVVV